MVMEALWNASCDDGSDSSYVNLYRPFTREKMCIRDRFIPDADIPEEPIMANIDPHQMQRVFDNIISNAMKHNPGGTALCFWLMKDDGKVKIMIGDNGCLLYTSRCV